MNLKLMGIPSDAVAMFIASPQPLPLSEACLQCLCASLNAPVVHVEGLPVGPARAALVVYAEQYGDLGVAVGIRSLEGGEVVLMRYRESLPMEEGPARALELATSYAEGLGFVFDQDMISPGAPLDAKANAMSHWQHLAASDEAFEAPDVASPPAPSGAMSLVDPEEMPEMEDLLSASAGANPESPVEMDLDELSLGDVRLGDLKPSRNSELLLDELAPLEIDDGVIDTGARVATNEFVARASNEAGEPSVEEAEPILEVEARKPEAASVFSPARLSKFRRPEDGGVEAGDGEGAGGEAKANDGGDAPKGGSALGRIQIVRKRKNEDGRATARSRIHASY